MTAHVDVLWIPLGSGQHIVRLSGRLYERLIAGIERRPYRELYHAALTVTIPEARWVIEVAPVPDDDPSSRGAVGSGPVGSAWLGRFRVFRYELRCWPGGDLPDEGDARIRHRLDTSTADAHRLLELVRQVPMPVWGRDDLGAGEMWNSNSVVSWALTRWGTDVIPLGPPPGGRGPGWEAGIVIARRDRSTVARPPAGGD